MKMNIFKSLLRAAGFLLIPACITMSSCSEDIDESDLYTFTGETIEDFISNNSEQFSSFNYILTRSGYDRILSTYGSGSKEYYTCFVPDNAAVAEYIDSLYNDKESKIEHNGMTENSLEGLSDSLCMDITLFHVLGTKKLTTDMNSSGLRTLLGRMITTDTKLVDGKPRMVLNDAAAIIDSHDDCVNGVVHVIDKVIPRSNKTIVRELQLNTEKFSIFYQALEETGLVEKLDAVDKELTAEKPAPVAEYYIPKECKRGFTIFAETNEVFAAHGIKTLDDLKRHANEWYGKAATGDRRTETEGWYDYYRNNKIEVSTGTDYTNEHNTLNMFMRYHILNYALSRDALTLDHNILTGYGYPGDAYDYYETMLPKTLMKVWWVKKENKTYINRYVANNTLTDGVETIGSAAMHELIYKGCEVDKSNVISPLDGYIYPIDDILLYDSQVPMGVLNERIRIDAVTMLGELMSNGFRGMKTDELTVLNGGKTAGRARFPIDYFDNLVVYNGNNTQIDMNILAGGPNPSDYLLYRGDSFQGMGIFDFAIKLPPVPDGVYEIRINLDCMQHGTMLQYYLGQAPAIAAMEALDIPLDMRMNSNFNEPRLIEIGCIDINDQNNNPDAYADRGLESDRVMRSHKYMRGPLSTVKSSAQDMISRFKAYQIRRILDTRTLKQQDYWMRLKTVLDDGNTQRKFQIDYVEFVPVNVAQNDRYLEDMY